MDSGISGGTAQINSVSGITSELTEHLNNLLDDPTIACKTNNYDDSWNCCYKPLGQEPRPEYAGEMYWKAASTEAQCGLTSFDSTDGVCVSGYCMGANTDEASSMAVVNTKINVPNKPLTNDNHITGQASSGSTKSTSTKAVAESSAPSTTSETHRAYPGPSVPTPRQCVYNSRSGRNLQCQVFDWDGDGYSNFDFGCPDCYDCNDDNPASNPGALDTSRVSGDQNCNGLSDEMINQDFDDYYDAWDDCPLQDENFGESVDNNGCWYSNLHGNLENWE
jgi:hypothetical protein